MRLISLAMLALFCCAANAQAPGAGETRPAPAPDEAEKSAAKAGKDATKPAAESDGALARCQALAGDARNECLEKERAAATGATRTPEPPTAPPPQNPR